MSKFYVSLDKESTATQIAELLNTNNKLKRKHTPFTILNNNIEYLIEVGGVNERHIDGHRKIIAVAGVQPFAATAGITDSILVKHLVVHEKYRKMGLASNLLTKILNMGKPTYLYVRSDNHACLNMISRLGFVLIKNVRHLQLFARNIHV